MQQIDDFLIKMKFAHEIDLKIVSLPIESNSNSKVPSLCVMAPNSWQFREAMQPDGNPKQTLKSPHPSYIQSKLFGGGSVVVNSGTTAKIFVTSGVQKIFPLWTIVTLNK